MNHVIRRTLFLLLCTLALAGCGAANERDALSVGDHSISEEAMTDLVFAVSPGGPERESVAALDANAYRSIGATWLQLFAALDYLESEGVVLEETDRESAKQRIEQLIVEGVFAPVSRESEAFDALIVNNWIATLPGALDSQEAQDAIGNALRGAQVASRIGTLDVESRQIFPRG